MLDCSASIVAYNNQFKMLRTSAESFLSSSLNTRLYIVDNSPHPVLKNVFNDLPVEYYFYGQNVGYGRAHNWAIKNGKESRYHLIMNPDIIITPGAIESLVNFMDNNEDVGMVCPHVINEDGTDQYLNKRYPKVFDLFARRFIPNFLHFLFKHRMDRYEMKDLGYDKICDVEVVSGAFMLCRKEILKALEGFDPRYFMYFEDFDLSRRLQQHGYRTVYYPNATVMHLWERAAHKNVRMTIIFIVNMCRYFNKWGWKWF